MGNVMEAYCFTYDHVLQSMFGQPAIEKHRNEEISKGGQKHLSRRKSLLSFLSGHFFFYCVLNPRGFSVEEYVTSSINACDILTVLPYKCLLWAKTARAQ